MSKDSNWYAFQDFIKTNFPDSNLHPTESFITHTNHLRFELGDGFENGTIERVDHCVKKAIKIFEAVFNDEDEVYILINSFKHDGGGEFYKPTNGYLEAQFSYFDETVKDENIVITSETDEFYNIDKEISEIMTITTHHIQKIFRVDLASVNYVNILRGTANLEMGLSPAISDNIYFINKSKKIVFYMYDDRGCMVYSSDIESIRFLYDNLYEWLVEYHIETFDHLFRRK